MPPEEFTPTTPQQAEAIRNAQAQSPTISTDDLVRQSNLSLPSSVGAGDQDAVSALTNIPSLEGIIQGAQQPTAAAGRSEDLRTRVEDITSRLTGRGTAQLEQETQLGIPQLQREAQELMNTVRSLQAEAGIIPFQAEQELAGIAGTRQGAQILTRERLRENAIKAVTTSALAQASLGNLQLAQAQADRAVELQFAPLEAELQALQIQYNMNKDILQREDAQAAQRLEINLRERERLLNNQKEEAQDIKNMALRALEFNATPEQAQQIANAKNFTQAMALGGQFLGEPFRLQVENQKFAQDIQRQQLSIAWAQLEAQQQQAKSAADQAVLAMNKEARAELQKTQAYQNWEMRGLIVNDLDNTLAEFAGTAERDAVDWAVLARSDSAVNAIATQLVYSRNPQLRRAVELGDAEVTADVLSRVNQVRASLIDGRNVKPALLADRVREIDTNYRASVGAYNSVVNDILDRNPGAVLPGFSLAATTELNALIKEVDKTEGQSSLNRDWISVQQPR